MIGVTITTFNRKRFTEQCLKSIAWSKPKNVKIVIVDNASEEETKDVVRNFAEENKDLVSKVFFNKKNLYVGKALNQGWKYLSKTCDILGVMDNDFFVEPGWDTNMEACFSELDIDALIGSVKTSREKLKEVTPSGKGFYHTRLEIGPSVFLWTKHFLNGHTFSEAPWKSGYAGPSVAFFRKFFVKAEMKGVRLCHPGIIVRKQEFTDPELKEYYDKTYKTRGLMKYLKIRREKEKEGKLHGIALWDWNEFLLKHYPEKYESEKE
jgi:glycosyltransferase involved in cell wall biosynthesis